VIALQTTERNGATVAALQVEASQELMLISSNGTLVRTPVADVSVVGRNTQGVRLIRLDEGERLTGVERIENFTVKDESAINAASSPQRRAKRRVIKITQVAPKPDKNRIHRRLPLCRPPPPIRIYPCKAST